MNPALTDAPVVTVFLKPCFDVTVRKGEGELSVRVQVNRPPLQWPVLVNNRPS
jgi:hypothetical protein